MDSVSWQKIIFIAGSGSNIKRFKICNTKFLSLSKVGKVFGENFILQYEKGYFWPKIYQNHLNDFNENFKIWRNGQWYFMFQNPFSCIYLGLVDKFVAKLEEIDCIFLLLALHNDIAYIQAGVYFV